MEALSTQSDDISQLAKALAAAQAAMDDAVLDSLNPHYRNSYASLHSIREAVRKPFSQNLLSYTQPIILLTDGQVCIVTTLMHASGQWIKSYCPLLNEKNSLQGLGSAITYARRYTLSAIAGISSDKDDDGEGAATPIRNKTSAASAITEAQAKMFFAKTKSLGWNDMDREAFIKKFSFKSINEIPFTEFNRVLDEIEGFKQKP